MQSRGRGQLGRLGWPPDAAEQGDPALRSAESETIASMAGLVAIAARHVRGLNSLSIDSILHPHSPSLSPQVTSYITHPQTQHSSSTATPTHSALCLTSGNASSSV